ncbi:hypothetical protein PoB_000281600 [Plakobranchus ocellatus]|uniref:Uncharacterized protein n=1 Tax=Plakobranchus ocellatus TaxID=259542 RepID=A0AAV3XDZ7_9GAST|nr:hypothetical protein PoB_000281600 [Plakobranchus ocellatus]
MFIRFLCLWTVLKSNGMFLATKNMTREKERDLQNGVASDLDIDGLPWHHRKLSKIPKGEKRPVHDKVRASSGLDILRNRSALTQANVPKDEMFQGNLSSDIPSNKPYLQQEGEPRQDPYFIPYRLLARRLGRFLLSSTGRKGGVPPKTMFKRDLSDVVSEVVIQKLDDTGSSAAEEYINHWPLIRDDIFALKEQIAKAKKLLDQKEQLVLQRINEGDELRKKATRVTNVERLEHFGKTTNTEEVEELKKKYKDLDDAIKNLRKIVDQEESEMGETALGKKIQEIERELRKRMHFVDPIVNTALKSGWSALTGSLADTTNFEKSALLEKSDPPPVPIFRYGDSPGEETYLDEELKNMQADIESLRGERVHPSDPDLEKVDEVIHDFLDQESTRVFEMVDDENVIRISGEEPDEDLPEVTGTRSREDDENDVSDNLSTMADAVFYLGNPGAKALDKIEDKGGYEKVDPGSITDNTVGADTNHAISESQNEVDDENGDDSDENNSENDRVEVSAANLDLSDNSVNHQDEDENADSRITTVDGDSVDDIKKNFVRKTRSVYQDPKAPVQKHKIDVEEAYDAKTTDEENKRGGVHTLKEMKPMGGSRPSAPLRAKSSEDKESLNFVDNEDVPAQTKMKAYNEEEEADDTHEEIGDEKNWHKEESVFKDDKDRIAMTSFEKENYDGREYDVLQNNNEDDDEEEEVGLQSPFENYPQSLDEFTDDTSLALGDESDLYKPDSGRSVPEDNFDSGVGSVEFWQKELDDLEKSDRRNAKLASDIFRSAYDNGQVNEDMFFDDVAEGKEPHEKPSRVSDLLSPQVQDIIEETEENEGRRIRPGHRPRLRDVDLDTPKSAGDGVGDEEEIESLNPGLGVMVRRAERKYHDGKNMEPLQEKKTDELVLSWLDDAPVDPNEFDYLHRLADISVFTKPVNANPHKLSDVPDPSTLSALERLDQATDTLTQTRRDFALRRNEDLKKKLEEVENLKHDIKLEKEEEKMEKMYEDIKAIPQMAAKADELREQRVQQYEKMHDTLLDAYKERQEKQKNNFKEYKKFLDEMKKNEKYMNFTDVKDEKDLFRQHEKLLREHEHFLRQNEKLLRQSENEKNKKRQKKGS